MKKKKIKLPLIEAMAAQSEPEPVEYVSAVPVSAVSVSAASVSLASVSLAPVSLLPLHVLLLVLPKVEAASVVHLESSNSATMHVDFSFLTF